ncbi:hypothetical protein Pint_10805 [Pistacia integerrima]|uniref:Uncharacterized protein n=1 Tax=Pistacia integerrima TaxID=434235 RepID=A0ACC0XLR1_9ROSI|nr:hypothetical protein Pint_10805 [Pistacia integerrima]
MITSTNGDTSNEDSNKNTNNYEQFNMFKLFVDIGVEEKPDPNKPYSLGPKISDWVYIEK